MSFADLERGAESSRAPFNNDDDPSLAPLRSKARSLKLQVVKVVGNNNAIRTLLDELDRHTNSTPQSDSLRLQKLTDLLSATTNLITSAARDLPELAKQTTDASSPAQEALRAEVVSISADIHRAKDEFQRLQSAAVQIQGRYHDRAKKAKARAEGSRGVGEGVGVGRGEEGEQLLELQSQEQIPDQEIQYQQELIRQRAAGIENIQREQQDIHQIFIKLDDIIGEQGDMIDSIEANVNNMADNVEAGRKEIIKADEYQRKAGKRMLCLMITFIIVLAIVLLAVLS